jgi:putative transposase
MPCLGCTYCTTARYQLISTYDMQYPESHKPSRIHPSRQSTRLPGYDYSQEGAYFVTICTDKHQLLFGNVSNGVMLLNPYGEIAQTCWMEITQHFSNVELSAFVIMPNHLHGILVTKDIFWNKELSHPINLSEIFGKPVSTSLPTIIRSYKSAVTRLINMRPGTKISTIWQRGYYEHVIRSEDDMFQIGQYILGNPAKWETDRENLYTIKRTKPLSFEC